MCHKRAIFGQALWDCFSLEKRFLIFWGINSFENLMKAKENALETSKYARKYTFGAEG